MKTVNVEFHPAYAIHTTVEGKTYTKYLYEYELTSDHLNMGDEIHVTLPYYVEEEPSKESYLTYVGSTENAVVFQETTIEISGIYNRMVIFTFNDGKGKGGE